MTKRNLEALFAPRAIALVGASRTHGSVGDIVARNLLRAGFSGPLMPVNPHAAEICGLPAFPSVGDLPHNPDLAILTTPAEAVPSLVAELGARGCRAALVISAGFEGEGRPAELKRAMLQAARPHLLRIIGPNCLGFLSPAARINASFANGMPPAGRVALVSQSGAVAAAAMDWASDHGLGFSHVATVGDCADVDVADLLDFLALDPATEAILLYLEGVSDGRKFMSAARAAARLKPVAVLKSGRSASGAKAALSHTGALAGAFAVYQAVFRRAGLVQVDDLGGLLQIGVTFAAGLDGAGDRLAILTNGGGAGVLAVDALEQLGERVCELRPETIKAISRMTPASWSHSNPVDILGDAKPELYGSVLKVLLDAPETDAVLVLNCPTAVADSAAAAGAVAAVARTLPAKPVLTAWLGGASAQEGRRLLGAGGLPVDETPEDAALAYAHLARLRRNRELLSHAPTAGEPAVDAEGARRIIDEALAAGRTRLTDPEARALIAAYGVPIVSSVQVATPEAAGEAARRAGGPVALKILSCDISHKSDVGGVVLDLPDAATTEAAARQMVAKIAAAHPEAKIEGFVVEAMVRRPEAQEVLAGVVQDPTFGPMVMVGHGGVAVEVLADRALGLPPLNDELAREMVAQTQVSRLLAGYRGRRPADLAALARTLIALGRLAADLPDIAELDINPLLCDADGVLALDARIGLRNPDVTPARPAIVPYPAWLVHELTVDGRRLDIRPIRPDDAAGLVELVESCSGEDVRLRFNGAMRALTPPLAVSLTQIDYDRQMGLVAEADGVLIGMGQLCADPKGERAEFALLVRSDSQHHGIGSRLLEALLDYAAERGLAEVWGETSLENGRMLEIAREHGFQILPAGDPTEVRLARRIISASPRP